LRALIFANGDPATPELVERWLQPDAIVIAADGGARNVLDAGLTPDTVIGDFDSLPDSLLDPLERRGVRFIIHPVHKDETDLELAIQYALDCGATDIVIFSALGGRWDQSLGNILLLTLPALDMPARIVDQRQTMSIIRPGGEARIDGREGDTLSLIALGGDARGVTIEGCEYPLADDVLPFGQTFGISNVLTGPIARVRVRDGIVLVIHMRQTL